MLKDLQDKVLQLDRRNKLLYYKDRTDSAQRRKSSIQLHVTPAEVDQWLESSKPLWLFPHFDVRGNVETFIEGEDLQRRLRNLRRKEIQFEEEQGLNVLFLAVGFLEWIEQEGDQIGEPAISPLVLLPCDLQRNGLSSPFYLKPEDDLPEHNQTLQKALETKGVSLPELKPDSSISDYLQKVRNLLTSRAGWRVHEDVFLDTFSFSRISMYKDYEHMLKMTWSNPLIRQIAGVGDSVGESNDHLSSHLPKLKELSGGRLDDLIEIRDQFTVLDADFSQLRAIEASRKGSNLVIHGPPGTGKSQTIANLIATLLADRKKVLFVSEKKAALDVVKRRLEQCHLGVFCLDLHSRAASKASVYEQLRASLDDPREDRNSNISYDNLKNYRSHLNEYTRALHRIRNPLEKTVFNVQGEFAKIRDHPTVEFKVGDIAQLSKKELEAIERSCERIVSRTDEFREHYTSRWVPLKDMPSSLDLHWQIAKEVEHVAEYVKRIRTTSEELAQHMGTTPPVDFAGSRLLADLLEHFTQATGVHLHWLREGVIAEVAEEATLQLAQQKDRRRLQGICREAFGEAIPELDFRSIEIELQRISKLATQFSKVLGKEWEKKIVVEPNELCKLLVEARDALVASNIRSGELSKLLDFEPSERWKSFSNNIRVLDKLILDIATLHPVPRLWLERDLVKQTLRQMSRFGDFLTSWKEEEFALAEDFTNEILEVVDCEMLDRFRGDYLRKLSRLKGGYRSDLRCLRNTLHQQRRLSFEDAQKAVRLAIFVKNFRRDWKESKDTLEELVGSMRFDERETEIPQIIEEFKWAIDIQGRCSAPAVTAALVYPERLPAIKAELESSRKIANRTETAFSRIGRGAMLEKSVDTMDLQSQVRFVMANVKKFEEAVGDLLKHFRTPPSDLSKLKTIVSNTVKLLDATEEEARQSQNLSIIFKGKYNGPQTDWEEVITSVSWTKKLIILASPDHARYSDKFKEHITSPMDPSKYAKMSSSLATLNEDYPAQLKRLDKHFNEKAASFGNWLMTPYGDLINWAGDIADHAESVSDWQEYQVAVRSFENTLEVGLLGRIREVTENADDVPRIVRRRIYSLWLDHIFESDHMLGIFNSADHDDICNKFRELDRQQFKAKIAEVRQRCFDAYPDKYSESVSSGQLATLKKALIKKKHQPSVRNLLRVTANVTLALKPCFMMSPLAVSQYLPRSLQDNGTLEFDVVIFDEASQVFPEDAIPALVRARQAIVAGDRKQLPPTSFFKKISDDQEPIDDEEDDEPGFAKGMESILDVMVSLSGPNLVEEYLSMHYRSRSEDLIRYSNKWFYKNRLLTFPDAGCRQPPIGIEDVYLAEACYDAGGARTNREEAEKVVEITFEMMKKIPEGESIGVVALSRAQANLIEDLMHERRVNNREFDWRFKEDVEERFFIKNLENVQGDERDHIIICIGYGPTATGKVLQRFGPISNAGGERRLNVAVSRARRSMTVVHSIKAEDINEDSKYEGPRLLRRFLEYIRNPRDAFESQETGDADAEPESPFEEAVRQALVDKGYNLRSQIGVSGYRIDLGVLSEDGKSFDLGIECDGATYHSAPAARDRDRLRQEVLESLGWKIHRIWSTSWVRNPEAEMAKVENLLRQIRAGTPLERPKPTDIESKKDDLRKASAATTDSTAFAKAAFAPPQGPTKGTSGIQFTNYKEASLRNISIKQEFCDEARETSTQIFRRLVEVEGPIHMDLLIQRIRDLYGYDRARKQLRKEIVRAVAWAVLDGEICYAAGAESSEFLMPINAVSIRPRRPIDGNKPRNVLHIALNELKEGTLVTVKNMYGASSREELIAETAKQFGYKRTGAVIEKRIGQAVDELIEEGRLRWNHGSLEGEEQ